MLNIYKDLKAKEKDQIRNAANFNKFLEIICSMFNYDGVPESWKEYFYLFEQWLRTDGCLGVGKVQGELVFARGSYGGGELSKFGVPTRFIGATGNGIAVDWEIGKDCVLVKNNNIMSPDLNIMRQADVISEIDLSIDYNIIYSRYNPLIVTKDEKAKKAIDTFFANMKIGEPATFISNNIFDVLDSGEPISTVDITDVKNSDKIQYLAHFRDDVERWFLGQYGQCSQSTAKMAQQTETEVNGNTSISFLVPLDNLKYRRNAVEEINAMFGTNLSVEFSESWQIEYKKFVETATQNGGDETDNPKQEEENEEPETDNEKEENEDGRTENNAD